MRRSLSTRIFAIVSALMLAAFSVGAAAPQAKLRVGVVGIGYQGGAKADNNAAQLKQHALNELAKNDKVEAIDLSSEPFRKIKKKIVTDGSLLPKDIRDKTDVAIIVGAWHDRKMFKATVQFIKSDTGAIISNTTIHEKKDTPIFDDISKVVNGEISKLISGGAEHATQGETPQPRVVRARGVGVMPITGSNPLMAKRGAFVLASRDAAERGLGAVVELVSTPDQQRRQVIAKLEANLQNIATTMDERQGDVWVVEIEADVAVPPDVVSQFPAPSAPETTGMKPAIQFFKQGSIDWESGVITARGRGRLAGPDAKSLELARRAARVNAYAIALEMIQGINFDPEALVIEQIALNPQRVYRIRALVQGSEVVGEKKIDDATLEVTVTIPTRGVKGVSTVFDDLFKWQPITPPILPDDPEPAEDERGVTGLIIDARGKGVMPAIAPVVVDDTGAVVYGVGALPPEVMRQRGGAAYVTGDPVGPSGAFLGPNPLRIGVVRVEPALVADNSPFSFAQSRALKFLDLMVIAQAQAKAMLRQGVKPVTVVAKANGGKQKAKVVVSAADAQKIKRTNKKSNYLAEGKVIIITDSMVGATEGRGPVLVPAGRFAAR